ncbi:hypothetical protein PHISCL_10009 [Aspergillus sclerotialis]|uniref:Uncharacterized protein n=1 Tax=Aspergillus sclerotialis TaxID=2070753 RepID=A0A3A2ZE95_9EURO|nr:hypothetical protein PHISCL_10009 [Aspergillus sclerotialis]
MANPFYISYVDSKRTVRDRIEDWLSHVEEPYEYQATPFGSPTLATRNIQPAGLAELRDPKAHESIVPSKERSTRFLSVEPPSGSPAHLEKAQNHNLQNDPYERRPRHKTRPDRYEYKEQSSRVQKKRKGKPKTTWSMMKRKRTINDNFHASNVPQSRLTLQSGLNTGIFQKGKTSSPVKNRELPDLAFSEMKFLSKKSQVTHNESATRQTERKIGRIVEKTQRKVVDYGARFMERTGTPRSTEKRSPLQSEVIEPGLQHSPPSPISCQSPNRCRVGHAKDGHFLHHAADPGSERKRKRASSHIPYTWSESQFDSPAEIYEHCLKKLLPVDPIIQQERSAASNSISRYWDIEELKNLLEERKRLWDSHHRDSPVYDDDPSCERGIKRRRLLYFDRQEGSQYCNQSNTKMAHWTPVTSQETRNLKTVPIPASPSALRSTYRNFNLNEQAHQKQLHGSPAQVDTGFACSPRELWKEPDISHRSHCYPPPQQHDSVDADARIPIFESELRWIDTHCPGPLDRGPPVPEEDKDLFMQYVDPTYEDIINLDLEFIDQQNNAEGIFRDIFEEYEEMFKQERNTVTTVPIYDEPWPSIEQPHQSTKGKELHAELVEPSGFIVQGQYRFRSESPHFVHPPLPGGILQIQEMEEIRAKNPRPGIPRAPSTAHPSHALADNEMAGFWRENKLY